MFLLYTLLGIASAEDVLVPHITPVQFDDLGVATTMEELLVGSLEGFGLSVVKPIALDDEFPEVSSSCFDVENCSAQLLGREHARMALIGSLETTSTGYNIQMRFYSRTSRSPLDVQSFSITKDELEATVKRISEDASVMFSLIPAEEKVAVDVTQFVTEKGPTEPNIVIIEQFREKEFVQPPPTRVILSLPAKFEQEYLDSNMMPDAWVKQRRIRAGNILVELHSGLALGDVNRSYDTRIGIREDGDSIFDIYEYETFSPGTGSMLGGAIGYAPLWWMELNLYGGVILAQKDLSTGWEQQTSDGSIINSDELDYDPVLAVSGHVEPRIRLYMVPAGPVKPYVLTGAYFRWFDPFQTEDLGGEHPLSYSDLPSGVHYGVTAGGGVAFDSAGPVGVFFEVPWTYVLSQEPYECSSITQSDQSCPQYGKTLAAGDLFIQDIPSRPNYSKQILAIKVGMTLRFH